MKVRQKITLGLCFFYVFCVIGLSMSLHFYGENHPTVKSNPQIPSVKENTLPTGSGIISFLGPVISEFIQSVLPVLFADHVQYHHPVSATLAEAHA